MHLRMRVLGAAAALVLGSGPVRGASFEVMTNAWTSPDGGTTQYPFELTTADGPGPARSVSGRGEWLAATVSDVTHYGAGSLFASAAPGLLRLRVDALAFVNALPFYEPRVLAGATARMIDTLTVTSPTLPSGSTVDYTVTLQVAIFHNDPIYYKPDGFAHGTFQLQLYFGAAGGTMLSLPVDFGGPSASWPVDDVVYSQELTGQATVGGTIPLHLTISASAQEWARTGNGLITQTHIDAARAIRLLVVADTPGVVLVSESGHDYATTAPEPGALAQLAGAVGGLAVAARGRASRRRIR